MDDSDNLIGTVELSDSVHCEKEALDEVADSKWKNILNESLNLLDEELDEIQILDSFMDKMDELQKVDTSSLKHELDAIEQRFIEEFDEVVFGITNQKPSPISSHTSSSTPSDVPSISPTSTPSKIPLPTKIITFSDPLAENEDPHV